MNRIWAKLVFGGISLVSLLPFPILYIFSDILYVILYSIIGYRKEVVETNLKNSFPNKSDDEIKIIVKKYYVHLADMMVESIKAFTISEKEIKKRFKIENLELARNLKLQQQNVIALMGHYANWEWLALSASLQIEPQLYTLYRKLKSKTFNDLVVKNRGRFGLDLIPERQAFKKVEPILAQKDWAAIVFIADQAVSPKKAFWVDFLNQKTTFVMGPEKYAHSTGCPLVFLDIQKIKRGYYCASIEMLSENPRELGEGGVTKLFASRLEQQISQEPAYWIWSHRRWKYQFPGGETKSISI